MAGQYDITADGGATLRRSFTWRDAAGNPVDLTGYSARMQVRSTVDSDEVLLECTTENNRLMLDVDAGRVVLVVEHEETTRLAGVSGRYDLELHSPGDVVTRLVEGKFRLRPEVTRD